MPAQSDRSANDSEKEIFAKDRLICRDRGKMDRQERRKIARLPL